jgi:hypothetical protein
MLDVMNTGKEPFGDRLMVVGGHVNWSAIMIDPSDGIQIV